MENFDVFNNFANGHRLELQSDDLNLEIVRSLRFVITNFFLQQTNSLVLTIASFYEYRYYYFRHLMEHFMADLPPIALQLITIRNAQPRFVAGERRFNLYMVDTLQAFLDVDPVRYVTEYNTNEYYYIFLQELDELIPESVAGILDYCWRNYLLNCNVQVQTVAGQHLVYTYFPFTAEYCRQAVPQLVNEFVGDSFINDQIFPQKLLNLHGCPLRVVTWHYPPFVLLPESLKGAWRMGGIEGNLFQTMADRLNFSIQMVPPVEVATVGKQRTMVTTLITNAVEKVRLREADVTFGYTRHVTSRTAVLSALFDHYKIVLVLSVLRSAQQYSSLEILSFPFQNYVWYLLLVMVIGFFVGWELAVYLLRITRHHVIYLCNIIAITLGIPITNLPTANYKRISFMNIMLSTFILRSIYAALLFDLFRTQLYRQPPDSMTGLQAQNYTLVVNYDVYVGLIDIPTIINSSFKILIINSNEETAAFSYLEEYATSKRKLVAIGARDILINYGRENVKPGIFYILPEVVMHMPVTFYVSKHSFLISQFNELLMWIQAVGLMEYWVNDELNMQYFYSRHLETPKFIGQHELNGIYYICGGLELIAFGVFLIELWVGRKRN